MAKSKIARRKARRKSNPEIQKTKEFATTIGAGFVGYAVTSFAGRAIFSQAVKKYPGAAKHIAVLASAAGAAGVYFGSKYWDKASEHHEAITIGAGIALLKSAVQTYVPKYGWIVGDLDPVQYAAKKKTITAADIPPEEQAVDNFDLDALLQDNDLEAVPIGQIAGAAEEPADATPPSSDEDWGVGDDLENYNGMLN